MLTDKEKDLLQRITQSKYHDGLEGKKTIDQPVWVFQVTKGESDTWVINSLVKKNLVTVTSDGLNREIAITKAGWEALNS